MVTNQKEGSSKYLAPTVVDSSWIFVAFSDHHPILTKLGAGETIDGSVAVTAGHSSYRASREVSFATPTQGWVIAGDGALLSTTDGGATWNDISPGSPSSHLK